MPRYFFNIHDGHADIDETGTMLDDIHDARLEAVRFAGRFIEMHAAAMKIGEEWRLETVEETGLLLFRIDFVMSQSPAVENLSHRDSTVDEDRIVGLFQMAPSSVSMGRSHDRLDVPPPVRERNVG